jgi:DNA-binding NarL/FixJ family response regulator
MEPVKIVVIHDDLKNNDPFITELGIKYGFENVKLIQKSKEGLDYVFQNLSQKMVVILDLNFKAGEPSGAEVFESIRRETSLVYIIIWTASDLSDVKRDDLVRFINNDALAFLDSTSDYAKMIDLVDKAAHQLDVKVASALEQWISKHTEEEKNKPYVTNREGQTYTLSQILTEIRKQTPFGMEMEKNILILAIDMLARGKKEING